MIRLVTLITCIQYHGRCLYTVIVCPVLPLMVANGHDILVYMHVINVLIYIHYSMVTALCFIVIHELYISK